MWPREKNMEEFQALSYGEKWRLRGIVIRGEAPDDPRLAAAAIELAESYQRQDRRWRGVMRWWPSVMIVAFGLLAIFNATEGDVLAASINAVIATGWIGHYLLNPATRPKRVAQALAASRQIVAAEDG